MQSTKTKMNADHHAGQASGKITSRNTLNGDAPRSLGRLDGAVVDRRELEEHRRDHEQHVELHERQVDGEVREEQEVERLEADACSARK